MACSKKEHSFDVEKVLQFDVEEFSNIYIQNLDKFNKKYEGLSKSIKSTVSYIPLQTTSECLIGEISKLVYTDKYIYVWDEMSNKLYQFDTKGQFVRQIGQIGEGPDRYSKIGAFDINKGNGNISVYCENKTSIIEYNDVGEIVKIEKTGLMISDFVYYKNHYLFYFGQYDNEPIFKKTYPLQYRLASVRDSVINEQYLPYKYNDYLSNTVYASNTVGFYRFNEHLMLVESQTGIVYKIDSDRASPTFAVDFGKYNIPFDIFSPEANNSKIDALANTKICHLLQFCETNDFIYIRYAIANNPICSSIYSKNTDEVIHLGFWWQNNDNILMPSIVAAADDALTGYYEANIFCNMIKHNRDKVAKHLIDLADKINDDDNPIVCRVKLQK
jgi:hypothetical protein